MYKQIIIVRSDLNMTAGKMAAQVAHASLAFLLSDIQSNLHYADQYNSEIEETKLNDASSEFVVTREEWDSQEPQLLISGLTYPPEFLTEWINQGESKIVLAAKNKSKLLNAIKISKQLGMIENQDFFAIYDNCRTFLHPEEPDGTTLTCIGFRPMDEMRIDEIGKHFPLYK